MVRIVNNRSAEIRIRLSPAEKQAITDVAKRAGLPVSAWVRSLALRVVQAGK